MSLLCPLAGCVSSSARQGDWLLDERHSRPTKGALQSTNVISGIGGIAGESPGMRAALGLAAADAYTAP
jgi:hypothetical protein